MNVLALAATVIATRPELRDIFDMHYPYVCASLRRFGIAESDREDLAIEVFCRVNARLREYDVSRPLKPWLFAFVARVASEHRKRERRRPELVAPSSERAGAVAGDTDATVQARDARRLVLSALEALDDDKRTVFVLHDLDECSVPDIAASLGIPEGTVYTRLRAARTRFSQAVRRLMAHGRAP